jgi:uncharacterized phage protein (TIGR01671 family)
MNREIKFRAWHKDLKKMFKIGQITLEEGTWNFEPNDRDFIGMSIPYQPSFVLMQYTGIHDKNGKEIYEGDIVEITKECVCEKGIIVFKNGCFFIKVKENLLALYNCEFNNYKVKKLGNIYDNP